MDGRIPTCSEIEHVKVRGEVVADVPPGQVVEVGLMEEVPAVPSRKGTRETGEDVAVTSQCEPNGMIINTQSVR